MTTVGQFIQSSADLYTEHQNKSELTEKDFLAAVALDRRCGQDESFDNYKCIVDFNHRPDQFIDETLGKDGTESRRASEGIAKKLYELSLRYYNSTDEYRYNHPYQQEYNKILYNGK